VNDVAIGTETLRVRPLSGADAPELHRLWTAPAVRRFLWDGETIPLDRTASILQANDALFAGRRFGLWGAREGERLVAFGGLWHFREPPELELIYGVAEDRWRRGYATAIARGVVDYAFGALDMSTVRASTDFGNAASIRVLEKLGFMRTERRTVAGLDTVFYELRSA
jgi:[ribosomal protein S5]-alanine N-acetyltransferase